ncbi:MAG: ABC transporter substrate-binding protein [Limnochordia bacterium]|jgi:multiple sugar transport system substrate-binding protein
MRNTVSTAACFGMLCVMLLSVTAGSSDVNLKTAMWIAAGPEVDQTQAIFDTYMAANPGVKLELLYQSYSGYHDKMLTLAAGGVAPDVMVISRIFVPPFAENGVIQPVDRWIARDRLNLQRDVTEIASGTWNGKVYGIPIWGGPFIFYYNVDMFSTLGLPQPSDLSRRNDWTWDRLIELGKKITRDTDGNGVKDVFAVPAPTYWEAYWYTFIRTFGGDMIQNNRVVVDSPEATRGLQLFADMRWTHHIAAQPGEPSSFVRGTQALDHQWVSEAPNIYNSIRNTFTIDMVTMPSGPAGRFHTAGGCPVCVSSSSQFPEEAYKFATWFAMYSDEWRLRGIPASMNTTRREYREYLGQFFASPDALIEALSGPTAIEPSVHPQISQLQSAWKPIFNTLIAGRISGTEAAAQLARSTNAVLGTK